MAFAFHTREDIGDVVQAPDQAGPKVEAFGTVRGLRRGLFLLKRREPGAEASFTTTLSGRRRFSGFPQCRRDIILERQGRAHPLMLWC